MKKLLTKKNKELYYYKNGERIIVDKNNKNTYPESITGDIDSRLQGNISELRGDINSRLRGDINSGLRGDISGLWGNISELRGDISGLWGDATDYAGNIDTCELTEEERKKGVNIEDLAEK